MCGVARAAWQRREGRGSATQPRRPWPGVSRRGSPDDTSFRPPPGRRHHGAGEEGPACAQLLRCIVVAVFVEHDAAAVGEQDVVSRRLAVLDRLAHHDACRHGGSGGDDRATARQREGTGDGGGSRAEGERSRGRAAGLGGARAPRLRAACAPTAQGAARCGPSQRGEAGGPRVLWDGGVRRPAVGPYSGEQGGAPQIQMSATRHLTLSPTRKRSVSELTNLLAPSHSRSSPWETTWIWSGARKYSSGTFWDGAER